MGRNPQLGSASEALINFLSSVIPFSPTKIQIEIIIEEVSQQKATHKDPATSSNNQQSSK
jgi:hypothetical protein